VTHPYSTRNLRHGEANTRPHTQETSGLLRYPKPHRVKAHLYVLSTARLSQHSIHKAEEKAEQVSLFTAWFSAYSSTPKIEAILSPRKVRNSYRTTRRQSGSRKLLSSRKLEKTTVLRHLLHWHSCHDNIKTELPTTRTGSNTCDANPCCAQALWSLTSLVTINVSIGAVP
jgi:hypothetical protein